MASNHDRANQSLFASSVSNQFMPHLLDNICFLSVERWWRIPGLFVDIKKCLSIKISLRGPIYLYRVVCKYWFNVSLLLLLLLRLSTEVRSQVSKDKNIFRLHFLCRKGFGYVSHHHIGHSTQENWCFRPINKPPLVAEIESDHYYSLIYGRCKIDVMGCEIKHVTMVIRHQLLLEVLRWNAGHLIGSSLIS